MKKYMIMACLLFNAQSFMQESPVSKLSSSKGFLELLEEDTQQSGKGRRIPRRGVKKSDVTQPVASSSTETLGNTAPNEDVELQIRASRHTGNEVYVLPPLKDLTKLKVCPPFAGLFSEPLYYTLSGNALRSTYAQSQSRDVNDVPCFISFSYKGYQLEFYQLRTINQSMKVDGKQIFADTCGGLALFAAEIMARYAHSGDTGILKSLYDVPQARLKAEQCYYPKSGQLSPVSSQKDEQGKELVKERLYSEQVQFLLETSSEFQDEEEKRHIALLESPQNIVSSGLEASSIWGFNREPMRQALADGLRQDSFYYSWIMGNEDEVERGQRGGHWYCVTLLKVGKKLQFIVIDSLSHYHLFVASYDFERLERFAKTIIDTWLK